MAIIAAFGNGSNKTYTKSVHQYDRGQKLIITGVELPEKFEVHISNNKDEGIASSYAGSLEGTLIPDAYFISGEYVYIWFYGRTKEEAPTYHYQNTPTNEEESDPSEDEDPLMVEACSTIYEVVIPVIRRPVQLSVVTGSSLDPVNQVIGYTVDDNGALIPVIKPSH